MKLDIILKKLKDVKGIWSDPEKIIDATGLSSYHYDLWSIEDDQNPFTEKPFVEWICTDTHVGWKIIYMYGNPILVSWKPGRKCEETLTWIGVPENKIRKWAEQYLDYGEQLERVNIDTDIECDLPYSNNYTINIFEEENNG